MSRPKLPKGPPNFDIDGYLFEVARRGWTHADVIRRCVGINAASIRQALDGLPPSPRVRAALEHALKEE